MQWWQDAKKSALFHHVGHGKGDGYACYCLGRSDRQKMGGKSRALLFRVIAGYRGTDRFNEKARIFVWISEKIYLKLCKR